MDVSNVFVSVGASNHEISCEWWSTALGRGPDRKPMPSCYEWDLTDRVFFQVLDNPEQGAVDTVSLRLANLEAEVARLREAGIAVEDPQAVPGFDTLRMTQLRDPDGNTLNLLGGE